MKQLILLIFSILLLTGCQSKSPSLLVPEEQLIDILVDAHLAEASIQNLAKDLKDSLGSVYYGQIYEIHQVDAAEFQQTMTMLREDPERLERIYQQVLDKLSADQVNKD